MTMTHTDSAVVLELRDRFLTDALACLEDSRDIEAALRTESQFFARKQLAEDLAADLRRHALEKGFV